MESSMKILMGSSLESFMEVLKKSAVEILYGNP